ncbi:hypothetical protein GB937_001791 [Aspergillus fischeri]|nr:hypothetical protein GB937_001791 [Aspergillus fischeri]
MHKSLRSPAQSGHSSGGRIVKTTQALLKRNWRSAAKTGVRANVRRQRINIPDHGYIRLFLWDLDRPEEEEKGNHSA